MSHDFHHHGIFSFSDHAPPDPPLAAVPHAPEPVYETAGMLSEMLNFGAANNNHPARMQFFLADPPSRSPAPATATHALLPTQHHEFLNWVNPEGGNRGLSLSLSSAKAEEEFRFNQNVMHLQGFGIGQNSGHFGFGSTLAAPSETLGAVNALRSSKFVKPTQELLEEFCSVGRGNLKKINKFSRNDSISSTTSSGGGGGPSSSNSGKDLPALSQADRMEHQRRKVKLLAMLDEVERRYSQYCEQMQMVVNSYDAVMGYGAAIPYTALAQKAMSRHFRCLKDAIHAQLKHSCELLGDKDVSASTGLTKGETPRLKVLEQSLRQQRAFHQMGMMEQEAWRPQRGLPERSVNVLRAWLFEHFLNPYPSDADKHLLARQTGLSRNQVSNWFINARVRLWKPMVEDMYQQESKDDDQEDDEDEEEDDQDRETNNSNAAQTSMPAKRSVIDSSENDPSFFSIQAPAEFAGVWPPAGDVSLTLGLRHSAAGGGQPEKSGFSFREFGS